RRVAVLRGVVDDGLTRAAHAAVAVVVHDEGIALAREEVPGDGEAEGQSVEGVQVHLPLRVDVDEALRARPRSDGEEDLRPGLRGRALVREVDVRVELVRGIEGGRLRAVLRPV